MSQLDWGKGLQFQVCPGMNEVGQIHKGVQAQAVVPVIRQVCHEGADLWETKGRAHLESLHH